MGKKSKDKGRKKETSAAPKAPASPRVGLLEENGEASRQFKMLLVHLFNRFDADKDRLLNFDELKAFSRAANGSEDDEFSNEELVQIKDVFDWTEKDGKSGLTLRGWQQMYLTQTAGDPEETWRDLKRLGYNGNLEPITATLAEEAAPAPKAEVKLTKIPELQSRLEEFIGLAETKDLDAFVEAFVAPDIGKDDREHFLENLKGGRTEPDGSEAKPLLPLLLNEVQCCATGLGVFKIDGENKKNGPVVFHFASQEKGAEQIDREVSFIMRNGRWYAEG